MAGLGLTHRIGLTGGIGSGKSTVSAMLARLGATIIDTDAIARELTQPGGAAMALIAEAFGPSMLDVRGALDRERMRALVFDDDAARRRLEGILHPLIAAEAERRAQAAAGNRLVFDVPLLVESGRWKDRVDRVLVVDCSIETQIDRVIRRSGWRREAVERVIARQASREARRAAADDILLNEDRTLADLERDVRALWRAWDAPGPADRVVADGPL